MIAEAPPIIAVVMQDSIPAPAPDPASTPGDAGSAPRSTRPIWSARIGGGLLVVPEFAGAKTYRFLPLPAVDVSYRDVVTANVADGLNVALIRSGGWRAGPTLRYRFGQYERDAPQALAGLGSVSGAIEAGATIGWTNNSWGFRSYTGWDLGTGHKGGVAEVSLFANRVVSFIGGRPLVVRVGPTASLATSRYFESYYGVDARQESASGLTRFKPEGGLERVGIETSLTMPLDRRWAVTLVGKASALTGDAAKSPRVRDRGSRWQSTLGVFVTYALGK